MKTENFEKHLAELHQLELPRNKYAIFGSGPLAIRGIRDVNDLDIIVTEDLWKKLEKNYPHAKGKKDVLGAGNIEICKSWHALFNIKNLIDTADIINGLRYVKLHYVIDWKKLRNSIKDKEDLKLIEKYLRNKRQKSF